MTVSEGSARHEPRTEPAPRQEQRTQNHEHASRLNRPRGPQQEPELEENPKLGQHAFDLLQDLQNQTA